MMKDTDQALQIWRMISSFVVCMRYMTFSLALACINLGHSMREPTKNTWASATEQRQRALSWFCHLAAYVLVNKFWLMLYVPVKKKIQSCQETFRHDCKTVDWDASTQTNKELMNSKWC